MKKNWLRPAAAAAAAICGLSFCGAANASAFGSTLTLDPSVYTDTARSEKLSEPKSGGLTLAENGRSTYRIVYPAGAGERLTAAARFFQKTFETISGAKLPLGPDSEPAAQREIVFGVTNRASGVVDGAALGADGYVVKTQGERLLIAGAQEGGTINGIYGYLEDELGCMWLAQDADYIPASPTVRIPAADAVKKPAMEWRNVYAWEAAQNGWFERLRLNGLEYAQGDLSGESKDGVNRYAQWGTWCHSYLAYVPVDQYFKEHPEYFAMKDGKRTAHDDENNLDTQLCLTNPEVYRIVRDEMKRRMEEAPDVLYWDFSVMDSWSVKGCECDSCRALDEAAGSGMGSLLPFLNELAKEFPDRYVSTLAYFHTIDVPKGLTAAPNVVIKLCSMPGDQASSYAEGATEGAAQFQKLVQDWSRVCDNIIIWDYVVDFSHLLLPFPNFTVQRENQKFYEDNKVMGVFHQASREKSDEFVDLRTYVLSHLMWEGSGLDVEALIGRYLAAFYGPAAPQIAAYMQLCAEKLHASQLDLGLYDGVSKHQDGYLSVDAIAQYGELFRQAEEAVANNEMLLARVKEAKIPVLYAKMMEESTDSKGKQAAADEMFTLARTVDITRFSEGGNFLEEFEQKYPAIRRKTWLRLNGVSIGIAAGLIVAGTATVLVVRYRKKRKSV